MSGQKSETRFAVQFFLVSLAVVTLAVLLGRVLIFALPPALLPGVQFPPAFGASSIAVLFGSWFLSRALAAVRRERQSEFRRQLLLALIAGVLFVAIQMSALNWLLHRQRPNEVQTGATAFVAVLASLHVLHFVVALLFLTFVTLKAQADRYDHEYYWGVLVCAWFWHTLATIWIAVLVVVLISASGFVTG